MRDIPVAQAGPDPSLGVFETLRIEAGGLIDLEDHLTRLFASLERLGWPHDRRAIEERAREAALGGDGRLRIEVFPDGSIDTHSEPVSRIDVSELRARGIVLKPVIVAGGLGDIKWVDRRCVSDVVKGEDEEALVLDSDLSVLETGRGNLFIWIGGEIVTPPTDGRILPGVTRRDAIGFLGAYERYLALKELTQADHVVATGTVRGALWVRQIEGMARELTRPAELDGLLNAVAGFV
jgi:para-aminobenzoate synthetase / 4-amino-4-deoxychorismate lyase